MDVLKKELKQMIDKQVWIPVNDNYLTSEERGQVIRSSVFFKETFRKDGIFDKLKARLVASGDMQEKELYEDVSSPTDTTESVIIEYRRSLLKCTDGRSFCLHETRRRSVYSNH